MWTRFAAVAVLVLLCRPVFAQPPDFEVASIAPAPAPIAARLGAVSVAPARPGRLVYPLPRSAAALFPEWEVALRSAVARTGLFRTAAAPRLVLAVRVLEFARRGNTLTVFARYQLRAPGLSRPLFDSDIMTDRGITSTSYVTPLYDRGAVWLSRGQLDAAVRANIAQFIRQLERYSTSPVFVANLAPAFAQNRVESQIASREPALIAAQNGS